LSVRCFPSHLSHTGLEDAVTAGGVGEDDIAAADMIDRLDSRDVSGATVVLFEYLPMLVGIAAASEEDEGAVIVDM
jgi:hypothetical protein